MSNPYKPAIWLGFRIMLIKLNNYKMTTVKNIWENAKINIREPKELGRWCQILRCSGDELKVAIYKVGASVTKVKEYLDRVISMNNLSKAIEG